MESATVERSKFNKPLFDLGKLAVTRGVHEVILQEGFSPLGILIRHQSGDWGEICQEDWALNNKSLNPDPEERGRLFSSYTTPGGTRIWIITEWDRSVTTLLLPDEY